MTDYMILYDMTATFYLHFFENIKENFKYCTKNK